ncbi:Aspartate racemase [bioreactor metagenome]|uniref:Aspartate racemase n=1 Tax=bioreactor metagenome TaxID=1076179 RepID=A0A644T9R0_9ZZZZ|nr:amino acid racemase [Negativicutes bacterium]
MAIIGILGGMGPMATADLFTKIIQHTPANCDQEHIRIIIDNHPQIPSRADAILREMEDPLPKLLESAKILENAGADFIIMPCNTAHFWYDQVQASIKAPMLHIIKNAAAQIKASHSSLSGKIMLLATDATVNTRMYQEAFAAQGMELLIPEQADQDTVVWTIDQVKAGNIGEIEPFTQLLDKYAAKGVEAFIGGCTEIPLLFPFLKGDYQKFDPTLLLAKAAISKAMNEK